MTKNEKTNKKEQPSRQVQRMVRLRCECGVEFERPEIYKKYNRENPGIPLWKWKLKYCDKCYNKRTEKALKRLPEILKALAT